MTFHFLYYAEYLVVGSTFLFREGRAKGIGKVVRLLHHKQQAQTHPLMAAAAAGAGGTGVGVGVGGEGEAQQQQPQQQPQAAPQQQPN